MPVANSISSDNITDLQVYFPNLREQELELLQALAKSYKFWNERINLISRLDIPHLYLRHLAHSLAVRELIKFQPKQQILDLGTGAGLPGLPLAIVCPEQQFVLVDARQKKIQVVRQIISELALPNVQAIATRAEDLDLHFDKILSRGVTDLKTLYKWAQKLLKNPRSKHSLLCLKGGAKLQQEIAQLGQKVELKSIHAQIPIEYFAERYLVALPS